MKTADIIKFIAIFSKDDIPSLAAVVFYKLY
jgi:hypothetical protein